ncbi:MAG: 6-hydroxymethylpterin diphosphokinase MptE-like protein [Candidatus Hydrothermarchaeaceae archaeon]
MNFKSWAPFYREILNDFGFSEEADIKAARLLNELLPENPPIDKLKALISGKTVNVFGAGPSLEKIKEFPKGTSIAADGATSFFIEKGAVPDIIVTDLDGRMVDIIEANKKGSIVVVHAHGDNVPELEKYVKEFSAPIGTTQAEPFGRLHNFGGFSDGDRCVFLAAHFDASEIRIFGIDFDNPVMGKYTFSKNESLTKKKLAWAARLIKYLNDERLIKQRSGIT